MKALDVLPVQGDHNYQSSFIIPCFFGAKESNQRNGSFPLFQISYRVFSYSKCLINSSVNNKVVSSCNGSAHSLNAGGFIKFP